MQFYDAQQCFEHAIANGTFTETQASDYMYMGTDEGAGFDMFKHIDSREYVRSDMTI